MTTLEELNQSLAAWIDGYYHIREHDSTKQPPRARAEASKRVTRRIPLPELMDIYLWEETRKVDKTGCVSLDGNHYEVDLELLFAELVSSCGMIRLTLSRIQVCHQGKAWPDAQVVDLTRRMDRRVKPEVHLAEETDGQLSFLELVEPKRQAALVFTDLARTQPPVKGVLAYTRVRTDCKRNDFSVIETDYNFGSQPAYYVSLGTNLDQTRLYLGVYGSMKVADFNQGTVFEIVR